VSLNGKYSNIFHICIKSCVLHAKSHVSQTPQLLWQHLWKNDCCCTSWLNAGNPGTLLTVLCSPKPSRCTFAISMAFTSILLTWMVSTLIFTGSSKPVVV
jgi:hypothetical protein